MAVSDGHVSSLRGVQLKKKKKKKGWDLRSMRADGAKPKRTNAQNQSGVQRRVQPRDSEEVL